MKGRGGQNGGRVGSPSQLSPPTYLDKFQIILKTYEFGLRFKERTAGMLQWNATVRMLPTYQGRKMEKNK